MKKEGKTLHDNVQGLARIAHNLRAKSGTISFLTLKSSSSVPVSESLTKIRILLQNWRLYLLFTINSNKLK